MLNYLDSDLAAKDAATFYAKKVGSTFAEEFFSGNRSLTNAEEALEVAKVFWEMTDLANTDHLSNASILDNVDIEFLMHKIFNKIYGYYEKNGFREQWKIAEEQFGS